MDADPAAGTHDLDHDVRDGGGAIVIIEGLDGTGKSRLAMQLYHELPAPVVVFHAGPPLLTTAIREYVWPLGVAGSGYTVICDRWHLGEYVWPAIFERESLIPTNDALCHVEENINYLRVPILPLFMTRPMKDIVVELQERQERVDHLHDANRAYAVAMADSSYMWRNTTLPKAPRLVKEWLNRVNG